MRQQKGYVFHRYQSWFVRFMDTVKQKDGTYKRKLVCKKLPVPYGGEYRTKKSVAPFVKELLAAVNSGLLNPDSTQTIVEFVEKTYFPEIVERQLRASSQKQYRDVWACHLKPRLGKLTLRDFRKSLPFWHGWHAFRRGLATNLHALGIDDKTIQAIMRHSNVGLTMNIYVKSVSESQTAAMDALSEEFSKMGETNNVLATSERKIAQ